jgi:hypothetical protein
LGCLFVKIDHVGIPFNKAKVSRKSIPLWDKEGKPRVSTQKPHYQEKSVGSEY